VSEWREEPHTEARRHEGILLCGSAALREEILKKRLTRRRGGAEGIFPRGSVALCEEILKKRLTRRHGGTEGILLCGSVWGDCFVSKAQPFGGPIL
jgi:hypothetical protein